MKAIVLVGGFGTRLRPLTLSRPKQMLPIGRATMLEEVVARLASHGVDTAVLSLGYQPDAFIDEFPDGRCAGVDLIYAVEPEPLDTAGAIAFAARHAGLDETFLALNGDVLSQIDLTALVAAHRGFGGAATIALTEVDDPSRFGVVPIDEDGRVIEFVEKPAPGTAPSNWINAGTYVLEPEVIDRIDPLRPVSIERETFPELASEGALYAVQSEGYWIDAGTPEAYLQAHLDIIDGTVTSAAAALKPDGVGGIGQSLIDTEAVVSPSASVSRSALGQGAVIGDDCQITDSVVMAGATIGAGSQIDGAIIGGGATLAPGTQLSSLAVVGFGYTMVEPVVSAGGVFPPSDEWDI